MKRKRVHVKLTADARELIFDIQERLKTILPLHFALYALVDPIDEKKINLHFGDTRKKTDPAQVALLPRGECLTLLPFFKQLNSLGFLAWLGFEKEAKEDKDLIEQLQNITQNKNRAANLVKQEELTKQVQAESASLIIGIWHHTEGQFSFIEKYNDVEALTERNLEEVLSTPKASLLAVFFHTFYIYLLLMCGEDIAREKKRRKAKFPARARGARGARGAGGARAPGGLGKRKEEKKSPPPPLRPLRKRKRIEPEEEEEEEKKNIIVSPVAPPLHPFPPHPPPPFVPPLLLPLSPHLPMEEEEEEEEKKRFSPPFHLPSPPPPISPLQMEEKKIYSPPFHLPSPPRLSQVEEEAEEEEEEKEEGNGNQFQVPVSMFGFEENNFPQGKVRLHLREGKGSKIPSYVTIPKQSYLFKGIRIPKEHYARGLEPVCMDFRDLRVHPAYFTSQPYTAGYAKPTGREICRYQLLEDSPVMTIDVDNLALIFSDLLEKKVRSPAEDKLLKDILISFGMDLENHREVTLKEMMNSYKALYPTDIQPQIPPGISENELAGRTSFTDIDTEVSEALCERFKKMPFYLNGYIGAVTPSIKHGKIFHPEIMFCNPHVTALDIRVPVLDKKTSNPLGVFEITDDKMTVADVLKNYGKQKAYAKNRFGYLAEESPSRRLIEIPLYQNIPLYLD